jgi:GNAT superfamily N-acetyltransferase
VYPRAARTRHGITEQTWTAKRAAARAVDVARREGARSLLMRVLGETFYRRMIVMERPFDPPIPPHQPKIQVEFAPLELDEVDEYLEFQPDADRNETVSRLERRHVCYVARHEGRIATACWIATERAWVDYLGAWISIASGVGYLYELYTPAEYRGKNIARAMFPEIFRHFREVRPPCVLAAFNPENRIQLMFSRLGFRVVGTVGCVSVGPWRHLFRRDLPGEPPARSFRVTLDEADSFLRMPSAAR